MTTYIDYPFTSNGVNFISRIFSHSDLFTKISKLPEGVFAELNREAIADIIGDPSLLSPAELELELERINKGGSHAFIMLGDN